MSRTSQLSKVGRAARLLSAGAAVLVGAIVHLGSMGCQCAALCGGITHILVTGHENALAKDPKASFKACGKTCASYQISGNNCSNDGSCSVTAAGVDILVDVDDVEEDSVSLEVIAENGDVLFKGQQKFVVTEDEVCGDTCYDSLATFAIP